MIFMPLIAPGTSTFDVNFRVADVSAFVTITGLEANGPGADFSAGFTQYTKWDPNTGTLTTVDLSTGPPFGCDSAFSANGVVSVSLALSGATHIEGVLEIFRTNSVLS